jgi:hypothetical protein
MSSGIPLGKWSGSDSTDKLRETIEKNSKEAKSQYKVNLALNIIILLVSICALIVSIYSLL